MPCHRLPCTGAGVGFTAPQGPCTPMHCWTYGHYTLPNSSGVICERRPEFKLASPASVIESRAAAVCAAPSQRARAHERKYHSTSWLILAQLT